jgi:metal-sulfur cluster biosynthetic enzyme
MSAALEDRVRAALHRVFDPCSVNAGAPVSIVDMGLVVSVDAEAGGAVSIALRPTTPTCTLVGSFMEAAEKTALAVPGVTSARVRIDMRLGWTPAEMSPTGRATLEARRHASRARVPVRPQEWKQRVKEA